MEDFESWFDFGGLGQAGGDAAIIAQEQRNKVSSGATFGRFLDRSLPKQCNKG